MTNIVRGAAVLTLILLVTPTRGGPRLLSSPGFEGPAGPHATQIPPPRPFAPARSLPSAFVMPATGNFQAQPLPRSLPTYVPSFQSQISVPQFSHPTVGHLTRNGTAHKQVDLRQKSIDPTLHTPATITAGPAALPIRSAPERSTRLSPGRNPEHPRPSYGPQWLMVEVENIPATPSRRFFLVYRRVAAPNARVAS